MRYVEDQLIEYNHAPFYSEYFMPYVAPSKSERMTASYARRVLSQYDKYAKRDSIKRLKARMFLHMPLTFGEICRLQRAQKGANGYAHVAKDFNDLKLEQYLIRD